MSKERPCRAGCNNPACCSVRCHGPLQEQRDGGLYGEHGALRRFTKAASGIHDIAEHLRAQSASHQASIMRKALENLAQKALDDGDEDVWRAALNMSVLPDDETLVALRKAMNP